MLETTPLVNSTSQGMLAKLLAKENITVEIGNYHTAFFDVKQRILGLPTWNVSNKQLSDLLVGHEVGHALYTPHDGIERFKQVLPNCPFDVLNIVEDIRIEKMVQDQYPGLISSFKGGYSYFIENDFFKIKGQDISAMTFINRLNLRGKIGSLIEVALNDAEEAIYQRCLETKSIDDVIAVCADIFEMIKEQVQANKPDAAEEDDNQEGEGDAIASPEDASPEGDESQDCSGKQESSKEGEEHEVDSDSCNDGRATEQETDEKSEDAFKQNGESIGQKGAEAMNQELMEQLTSETLRDLESELSNLQENITDYIPVAAPSKQQMMDSVIPVKKVMESRLYARDYSHYMSLFTVTEDWKNFKKSTKSHVNLLVKEFERRKAAFQYSRAQRSTTGSIDVNRLHSYRFEDQIFKSVTKLADAKNHGMIFFIDYSSSMCWEISKVITHTLNLVFFCKAVGIPFEVYGFTNPDRFVREPNISSRQLSVSHASVFELVNSTMSKKDYEIACRELRAQAFLHEVDPTFARSPYLPFASTYERMAGTPLYETIMIAHELVNRFKKKHQVQKMNVIFLTDGDGSGPRTGDDRANEAFVKDTVSDRHALLRVKLNGRQIELSYRNPSFNYAVLIENLKLTTGCTTLGFFITSSRSQLKSSAINSIRHSKVPQILEWTPAAEKVAAMAPLLRKNKCLLIEKGFCFDQYFIISAGDFDVADDDSFDPEIDEAVDMTSTSGQNKLAKAFTKYSADKRTSRIVLNKFAELVA